MNGFAIISILFGAVALIVSLFYIYERSCLLVDRQYKCPPNLLKSQQLADSLVLCKYITISLYAIEIILLGFAMYGMDVNPRPMILIANVCSLLYLLVISPLAYEKYGLRETYEMFRMKWLKGDIDEKYHEDEVNLFRAIRDSHCVFSNSLIATFQLLVLVLYTFG